MRVEFLVFFYIIVSIAMGLFEFAYLQHERIRNHLFAKNAEKTYAMLSHEILTNADFPTPEHKEALRKQLRRLPAMEAFDLTMDLLEKESPDLASRYLSGIADVFNGLAHTIPGKGDIYTSYWCYLVRKWYRGDPESTPVIVMLTTLAQSPSLYVRQNAISALAKVSSARNLALAFAACSDGQVFYHPRLLTETSMTFSGDKTELAIWLGAFFDELDDSSKSAVINYWRMTRTGEPSDMLAIAKDPDYDSEVRLSAMRYFATNPDPNAEPFLQEMASTHDKDLWEVAVVASGALSSYPTQENVKLLKHNLSSRSWFVRNAAASSLLRLRTKMDLDFSDVLEGPDRYASEMLRYHMELDALSTAGGGGA